jgi:DNA-binding LytR/AlgR family response regulator
MLIEYLGIFFVYLSFENQFSETPPGIVMNPFFIWLLLGALLSIEHLIVTKLLGNRQPVREKYITFTSDRRKVTLEIDAILCIESRDYEVTVVVEGGTIYPTRMKISQWEAVLDDRFIRIHRSFIVGRGHITRFDAHAVWLGELQVEVSRKYRENVLERLGS